jgi:hypothetical protein
MTDNDLLIPDYEGANLANLLPALLSNSPPKWLDSDITRAERIIFLILDGLGFNQLEQRMGLLRNIREFEISCIDSVGPTTTASALTSITTGLSPINHGLIGYRMNMGGEVLNVLKWKVDALDVSEKYVPEIIQPHQSFLGRDIPILTRYEFRNTPFSRAHLNAGRFIGWRTTSAIGSSLHELKNEPFVYCYYDGIDRIAHQYGFGLYYDRELEFVDFLLGEILEILSPNSAVVVTSDHGQVEVKNDLINLEPELLNLVEFQSGEARWRWLHVRDGEEENALKLSKELYGDLAYVMTKVEVLDKKLMGSPENNRYFDRLGDIALIAKGNIGFFDEKDSGDIKLVCRHGALSSDEVKVPLMYKIK